MGKKRGRAGGSPARKQVAAKPRFIDTFEGRVTAAVVAGVILILLGYFVHWFQTKPRIEKLETVVNRLSNEIFALRCHIDGGTMDGADCKVPGKVPERWSSPLEDEPPYQ